MNPFITAESCLCAAKRKWIACDKLGRHPKDLCKKHKTHTGESGLCTCTCNFALLPPMDMKMSFYEAGERVAA